MTKILAFDTHSESCSVCFLDTESKAKRCTVLSEPAARSHAQRILPMIDQVLAEANVKLADLDAIAFGRGPGSFTGLRIAAGVAQGLAYGAELPVLPVSNLQALAYAAFQARPTSQYCLSVIDARMDEAYWSVFKNSVDTHSEAPVINPELAVAEQVGAPESVLISGEVLSSCLVVGSGLVYEQRIPSIDKIERLAEVEELLVPAQAVAEIALLDFGRGKGVRSAAAAPVYIRDNVTWKKLPGR